MSTAFKYVTADYLDSWGEPANLAAGGPCDFTPGNTVVAPGFPYWRGFLAFTTIEGGRWTGCNANPYLSFRVVELSYDDEDLWIFANALGDHKTLADAIADFRDNHGMVWLKQADSVADVTP